MNATRLAILLLALLPSALSGQRVRREVGLHSYALFGTAERIGAALYAARRVGPRARLSLSAGGDVGGGQTIARSEGLVHLLLSPNRRAGVGGYLAGGAAVDFAARSEARLVALAGIEGSPGARAGWVLEAGVGGGWRVAAGWRWRR